MSPCLKLPESVRATVRSGAGIGETVNVLLSPECPAPSLPTRYTPVPACSAVTLPVHTPEEKLPEIVGVIGTAPWLLWALRLTVPPKLVTG